jgi:hypothetical protein
MRSYQICEVMALVSATTGLQQGRSFQTIVGFASSSLGHSLCLAALAAFPRALFCIPIFVLTFSSGFLESLLSESFGKLFSAPK